MKTERMSYQANRTLIETMLFYQQKRAKQKIFISQFCKSNKLVFTQIEIEINVNSLVG